MKNITLNGTLSNFLNSKKMDEVPKCFVKATGLKRVSSMYFLLDTFTRQYSAALAGFTEKSLELYLGLIHTELKLLNKSLLEIAELTELERTFQTSQDSEQNKTLRLDIEKFIKNFKSLFPSMRMTSESITDFLSKHNAKGNKLISEFYREFTKKHSVYGLVYKHLCNRSNPADFNNIYALFKTFNELDSLNRDTFILAISSVFSTLAADTKTCTIVDGSENCLSTKGLNDLLLSKLPKPSKTI